MISILLLLPLTLALSSHNNKAGPRVAGVNQVSSADDSHRLRYAFNASDAREVCRSLGLTIASKAQVQSALAQGFQTCRFGWIDEHFAVVPRVTPWAACGHGKTGLVEWRTSVRKHFDVFCFNVSDAGPQLKDTTADSLNDTEHARPPQQDATLTSDPLPSTLPPPSSSALPSIMWASRSVSSLTLTSPPGGGDPRPGPELFISLRHHSFQVPTKSLLISVTCALLLVITAVLGLDKLRNRSCFQNWDTRPQEDFEAENTCVIEEPFTEGPAPEETDRNSLTTAL